MTSLVLRNEWVDLVVLVEDFSQALMLRISEIFFRVFLVEVLVVEAPENAQISVKISRSR